MLKRTTRKAGIMRELLCSHAVALHKIQNACSSLLFVYTITRGHDYLHWATAGSVAESIEPKLELEPTAHNLDAIGDAGVEVGDAVLDPSEDPFRRPEVP